MYLSPETILFIREHRNDDVHSLALQAKRYPQVDMASGYRSDSRMASYRF